MHRLPATRDIDRCITAAVVRYLRARDIQAPSDIMQPGVVVDVHAAAPVRLIVQELARANVDTGNSSVGLTPSTTHSSLQSIGTGARQHLVDTDDMVWVSTDTEMETFLSGNLDQVPRAETLAYVYHCCSKCSPSIVAHDLASSSDPAIVYDG